MVRRVFMKDKALPSNIATISGTNSDWYNSPMAVYVDDWETLNVAQQTAVTNACAALNYTFDHDE